MTKEQRKYWLGKGCIHWIINWKSGFDCFGNKIVSYEVK
jgi:hypothetical protein